MKKNNDVNQKIKIDYIQWILLTLFLDAIALAASIFFVICGLIDPSNWNGYIVIIVFWSIAFGFNLIAIIYAIFCPYYLKIENDDVEIKIFRKKYNISKSSIVSIEHYTCNVIEALFFLFIEGGPLNTKIKYLDNTGTARRIFFVCSTRSIKKMLPNIIVNTLWK